MKRPRNLSAQPSGMKLPPSPARQSGLVMLPDGSLTTLARLNAAFANAYDRGFEDGLTARSKSKEARGRGRPPGRVDRVALFHLVEASRRDYEKRDGRPYSDRQAIRERVVLNLMRAQGLTREKATGLLNTNHGEGLTLQRMIETQLRYVRQERARGDEQARSRRK
jgi:hypothetical protein